MARPLWLVALIRSGFPDRFKLARATRWKPLGKLVEKLLFEGDELVILPSDRVISIERNIADPGQFALPSQVVGHFIQESKYHWIMNTCICRHANNCKDYPVELGCLFLGEAVMGINPALGRPVSKEEALIHARKCREAGLIHLIGRNKLDTVWLGVSPGNKLLTICNCCPCCCLWKWLPDITRDIGGRVHRMPGVTVSVSDACTGCGICADNVCFINAISMVDGTAVISGECRGCGRCTLACPAGAIKVIYDAGAVHSSISKIEGLVDVR
ncbi:MAG: 4Fe-4S binding protein [Dehalococcoidia bacterium]|nr:4Fe-4S binding protein [Dehalococcoidia bacterium]